MIIWTLLILGVWLVISSFLLGGVNTVLGYTNILAGAVAIFAFFWGKFGKNKI
ncbi:MAG: hypothetical protein KY053_02030 [Candidatus Liptonbacteria bacterium]|nr:hypothetical protein [Candidatus Liptonbacteria bacterium]